MLGPHLAFWYILVPVPLLISEISTELNALIFQMGRVISVLLAPVVLRHQLCETAESLELRQAVT